MTIGKNIDVQKVGTKNLEELAKLTILNILSVQGVIYTHYKNKQRKETMTKNKYRFLYDEESHRNDGSYLEKHFEKGILAEDESEAEKIVEKLCKEKHINAPYYGIVDWEDE